MNELDKMIYSAMFSSINMMKVKLMITNFNYLYEKKSFIYLLNQFVSNELKKRRK